MRKILRFFKYLTIIVTSSSVVAVLIFLIALQFQDPRYHLFSERNCSNFVMHVSILMLKERTTLPLSRSGNRKELYNRCKKDGYSFIKLDCSLQSSTLEGVHRCIYPKFS